MKSHTKLFVVWCADEKANTLAAYKVANNAHFKPFLKWAGWDKKDVKTQVFLTQESPGKWVPNHATFMHFALYLKREQMCSRSVFKTCFAFCRKQINEYLAQLGCPKIPEGYLYNIPGVSNPNPDPKPNPNDNPNPNPN